MLLMRAHSMQKLRVFHIGSEAVTPEFSSMELLLLWLHSQLIEVDLIFAITRYSRTLGIGDVNNYGYYLCGFLEYL
jgi:hypothetical protein